MSIEMENPKTLMEKIDSAGNLIEQMFLAHMVKNETKFQEAHKKAGDLLFDVMREMERREIE